MIEEIPAKSRVFIDSDIFIYHFLDLSKDCSNLLERAERREIRAYASTVVLGEVLHKLMLSEAMEKYGTKPYQTIRYLKEHPELIKLLKRCDDRSYTQEIGGQPGLIAARLRPHAPPARG